LQANNGHDDWTLLCMNKMNPFRAERWRDKAEAAAVTDEHQAAVLVANAAPETHQCE
jgi:hypothetical protein